MPEKFGSLPIVVVQIQIDTQKVHLEECAVERQEEKGVVR